MNPWLHRTGAWRDIPAERYGNHRTISSRFYRWRKQGLATGWSSLMQQADAVGKILGSPLCRWYGCTRPSACSWWGGPEAQALGRSHGGFSTKVHVKAEGYSKPMYFVLTGGERHETVAELVRGGKVKRQRGPPASQPVFSGGP